MQRVNPGSVIEQAIIRDARDRVSEKPPQLSDPAFCRSSSTRSSDIASADGDLCTANKN